jgi:hypothetical protein
VYFIIYNILENQGVENSTARDSGNRNGVRIYIGDTTHAELGNSTLLVPAR